MRHDKRPWGTVRLAVAVAIVIALFLSGCASSRSAAGAETVADTWGSCDRSRMVRVMLVCWQTKAEPVSDLRR